MSLRIIKVGGSLLDWRDLGVRFDLWLNAQPAARNIVVVGGGSLVDAVRRYDDVHRLRPAAAHWLAIEAMGVTARLAAQIIPSARLVAEFAELVEDHDDRVAVLDVRQFLADVEPTAPGTLLTEDWSVTSDSIAARLTSVLHADELVLLKSCDSPACVSRSDLALSGYVDASFPRYAAGIACVRCVNLRELAESVLQQS